MASPKEIIKLEDVTMKFGQETILKSVNLSVNSGEKLVLIGPSGEGKTVLLKLMAGILEPSSGRVFIEGKDLKLVKGQEKQELLQKMGMLFQKNALFDSMTSAENIAFPMREITELSEDDIQKKIDFYLEEVAIPHAKSLYPDEISGGMQKRLGIARALALNPEIIFYDDPTAGLDPITSRLIIDLICDLQKSNNSTIVAITNDMNRAYQMADKIAMVVDQGLVITGNPEQTKEHTDKRVSQFIRGNLDGPLTE